jgi:hypothetical protein
VIVAEFLAAADSDRFTRNLKRLLALAVSPMFLDAWFRVVLNEASPVLQCGSDRALVLYYGNDS